MAYFSSRSDGVVRVDRILSEVDDQLSKWKTKYHQDPTYRVGGTGVMNTNVNADAAGTSSGYDADRSGGEGGQQQRRVLVGLEGRFKALENQMFGVEEKLKLEAEERKKLSNVVGAQTKLITELQESNTTLQHQNVALRAKLELLEKLMNQGSSLTTAGIADLRNRQTTGGAAGTGSSVSLSGSELISMMNAAGSTSQQQSLLESLMRRVVLLETGGPSEGAGTGLSTGSAGAPAASTSHHQSHHHPLQPAGSLFERQTAQQNIERIQEDVSEMNQVVIEPPAARVIGEYAKQLAVEEAEKKKAGEALERQQQAEEAQRRRIAEEAERKRLAVEREAERKAKEEEERKKAFEEAERKRRALEAEHQRQADERARQRAEQLEALRVAAEEAQARQKNVERERAEDAERRRKQEEERHKAEAARRQARAEEAQRLREEEEQRQKAQREERKKQFLSFDDESSEDSEGEAQKQQNAARRQEEEEAKHRQQQQQAELEEQRRRREKEAEEKEEAERRRKEGAEAREREAQEQQRARAREEEQQRRTAHEEEERKRRAAELEETAAAKKKQEEEELTVKRTAEAAKAVLSATNDFDESSDHESEGDEDEDDLLLPDNDETASASAAQQLVHQEDPSVGHQEAVMEAKHAPEESSSDGEGPAVVETSSSSTAQETPFVLQPRNRGGARGRGVGGSSGSSPLRGKGRGSILPAAGFASSTATGRHQPDDSSSSGDEAGGVSYSKLGGGVLGKPAPKKRTGLIHSNSPLGSTAPAARPAADEGAFDDDF